MTDLTADTALVTGTVRVNDQIHLAYEQRGSGPDVVLVNNFFMDRKSWRSYTANLASTARLTSYDLRGQGDSGLPVGEPVWEEHITDLKALFDELGLEKAILVGTSFSTLICRDFAVAYPERVNGLVLAGPAMSPHGPQRLRRITKAWLRTLDTSGLGDLYDALYPLVSGDQAVEQAGPIGFMGRKQNFLGIHTVESLRAGLTVSVKAPLEPQIMTRVVQPTLLFVGGDDFSLSTSAVEEMTRLFPDATTVTVPHGGHLAFLEEPEWFQREVVKFIESVTGAGG